jgi:hypothetical protein
VFTARYALSPYIKQIRFVFKGLIMLEFDWNRQKEQSYRRGRPILWFLQNSHTFWGWVSFVFYRDTIRRPVKRDASFYMKTQHFEISIYIRNSLHKRSVPPSQWICWVSNERCAVGTQKLRLLHKSSIRINNGKPIRHFITTTWIIRLLFSLITYI